MENQKQIAGAIIIAGLLIAGAILLKDSGSLSPSADIQANLKDIKVTPISENDHILGNPNAKVVIVEYSDTECPFCKVFHSTMHKVIEAKGDEVAWVYRHLPLDCVNNTDPTCQTLHERARLEAEATECAWEQGGNDLFWQYTDKVFELTNSNDSLDPNQLPVIAETLGLNLETFNTCLTSGKYANKVQEQVNSAKESAVNATPFSFILKKGKLIDVIQGAQPFEVVIEKIEQAL